MMRSPLLALAAASVVAALIPTTKICNPNGGACYEAPVLHEGSCCGSWNVSSYIDVAIPGTVGIDTSTDYGSQPAIAQQIAASGIPRENLWITSKLNIESAATNMTAAMYEGVLSQLNTSYVDLILMHHAGRLESDNSHPRPPCFDASLAGPAGPGSYYNCRMQTVAAYQAIVAAGLARTWGVSNWQPRDLQQVYDAYGFYPPVNQIEVHPYWNARETVAFCNKHGIVVEAYAPFGDFPRSPMLSDPLFAAIAANHSSVGATASQVILTWELMTGADILLPRSSNATHQAQNVGIFDDSGKLKIQLNEWEVAAISSVHTYSKVYATECAPWC